MANTKTKATEGPKKSTQTMVTEFVKAQGSNGATALSIAQHLNLVNDEQDKDTRAKALKRVRVLARKAVGGASQARDGRSAIYSLAD